MATADFDHGSTVKSLGIGGHAYRGVCKVPFVFRHVIRGSTRHSGAVDSLAVIAKYGAIPVAVTYWTDCLVLLQQGDVAAISTDDSILDGLAAQDPWTKLIGPRLTDEPYGLAISKQHPDFVRFVNAVLQQLRTDGQWAASYAHWVGTPVPSPPPARYGG